MSHTAEVAKYLAARWREEPQTLDVQAKRRILDLYRAQYSSNDKEPDHQDCGYDCGQSDGVENGLGMALNALAQAYADRPDFQPQWRHMYLT